MKNLVLFFQILALNLINGLSYCLKKNKIDMRYFHVVGQAKFFFKNAIKPVGYKF